MPILITFVIFVTVVAVASTIGMRIYVRPKEAMERVVGVMAAEQAPAHPSLAFHDLIKRMGNFVPQSPKDVTVMRRRLIRAGVRNEGALKILYGAKAILGLTLPLIAASLVAGSSTEAGNKIAAILAAVGIGYTWESENSYDRASAAYEAAARSTGSKDFLYEESLMDLARTQELGGKPSAALDTYKRLLKEVPGTRRGSEIQSRVASLQSRPAK